ncbi:MAG: hypothetical protein JW820_11770 [Spirochaetales bacterium]|nr:hypothetical protein [Spirochaetales bacterium]
MKTSRRRALVAAALILSLAAVAVYSEEYYDHALVGRYEGSTVIHQESSNLDRYALGLEPAEGGAVIATKTVEGKVLMTLYAGPQGASSFEVFTAYRQLLDSKGFEVLFDCEKSACGDRYLAAFYDLAPFANDPGWNHSAPITQGNPEFSYVLVARSGDAATEIYVSLIVSQGWWDYPVYKLDVVEVGGQAGKISSVAGPGEEPAGGASGAEEPGAAPARKALRRPLQFGLQMSSDTFLGLILCANRFEFALKAQAVLYDGFPGGDWPDNNRIKIGAHTAFLFRPSDPLDISFGAEAHHAIMLAGDEDYVFYLRAGLRVGLNYHLGEHFMISGVVHPFWVETTETTVNDSYELTATIPTAAVAVSLFF